MKNIHEINPDNYGDPKRNALIVHHDIPVDLVKANRFLFCLVFLLFVIICIIGFSLVTPNKLLSQLENKQIVVDTAQSGMSPVLSKEIDDLKVQMVGLVSGSIESKLRVLELSIQSGSISPVDLGIIGDLRNDISVLRQFSKVNQVPMFAPEQETALELLETNQVMQEFTQLKMLIYITLASCGLMFAAVGGVWLQQRYLLGFEKKELQESKSSRSSDI